MPERKQYFVLRLDFDADTSEILGLFSSKEKAQGAIDFYREQAGYYISPHSFDILEATVDELPS